MLSIRKILQALYYIQSKAPSSNEARYAIMYLLKMIYLTDRYHIRHFGISATGDSYVAMEFGPVASATKDFLQGKSSNFINSAETYLLSEIESISEYGVSIKPQMEDELSDSFKEALNFVLNEFGSYNQFELSKITHDFPEWKKYEEELKRRKNSSEKKSINMDLIDFFENPSSLLNLEQHGKNKDPFAEDIEFLNILKEEFHAHTF